MKFKFEYYLSLLNSFKSIYDAQCPNRDYRKLPPKSNGGSRLDDYRAYSARESLRTELLYFHRMYMQNIVSFIYQMVVGLFSFKWAPIIHKLCCRSKHQEPIGIYEILSLLVIWWVKMNHKWMHFPLIIWSVFHFTMKVAMSEKHY